MSYPLPNRNWRMFFSSWFLHWILLALPLMAKFGHSVTYTIDDDVFGSEREQVRLKVLRNTVTGERVEVAWNVGGRTEALVLRSTVSGSLRSILLHSRRNASDVMANTGWKGDMLIPYANRIKNGSYELNGKKYFMVRNEDRSPYGKEGLHGYLYRKVMRVKDTHADNHSAALTLAYDFDGSDPGYPFPLSITLTYKLDSKGFTVTTRALNRGTSGEPLPFYNSWHSYFQVSDISRAVITLDSCSKWNHISVTGGSNTKGDLIPTGDTTPFAGFDGKSPVGGSQSDPTYWDDEFKALAIPQECPELRTRVTDPATGDTSVLWADSQYRWLQVFTGTMRAMGEQAIAVEAMSGECDSWNNKQGVRILQSGEAWEGTFGVYLEGSRSVDIHL